MSRAQLGEAGSVESKDELVPQRAPEAHSSTPLWSLLAPKTQDGDQEVQISRLQNGLSETNG